MILKSPDGTVLFHGTYAFQFLPEFMRDVVTADVPHSTVECNDDGSCKFEVTLQLNSWEAVKTFQEELALCALLGQEL